MRNRRRRRWATAPRESQRQPGRDRLLTRAQPRRRYGAPKVVPPQAERVTVDYIDGSPYHSFIFHYRSRAILELEGIVERTSPFTSTIRPPFS